MAPKLQILFQGVDNVTGTVKDVGKSFDTLESAADKLHKRMSPLNDLIGTGLKAGMAGLATGTAALGVAIGSSIKSAIGFEQGIADIAASMQTTSEETAQLKGLINNLALDDKLKVSATEATEAIGVLGTAGLSVDQILGGAAKSTVLLANATGADFAQAAAIATDVMSIFGKEAGDLDQVVNSIVGSTVASKFGIEDYAYALGTGAKGAAAAGISFEQFNAMLTATSGNFTSGMTAGTGLTAMMLGLAPSTEKAKDLMKELGIITADGRNRFFDLNGQVEDNAVISDILRDTLGKLGPEQRLLAVNTLFGRDAMAAVNGMINTTTDSWNGYDQTLANTDAAAQAATRMDTLSGALEIMWGVIESLQISIGDAFLPVVRKMAEMFTAAAQRHGPALIKMFADLAWQLGLAMDRFLPWVERRLPMLIEQIPAVVAGIGQFVTNLKDLGAEIWNTVEPIVAWVKENVSLRDVLIAIGAVLAVSVLTGIISFAAGVAGIIGALGGLVMALGPVLLVVGAIGAAIYVLYRAWTENWGGIQEKTYAAINYIKKLFAPLGNAIKQFGVGALKEIWAFVTGNETGFENLSAIWTVAKQTAQTFWNDLVSYVKTGLPIWIATLKEWGVAAWKWLVYAVPIAIDKLLEWGGALLGWVGNHLPAWIAKLGEWGGAAWRWIVDVTPIVINKLGEWGSALLGWVTSNLPIWTAKLSEWGNAAWQWIADATPNISSRLREWGTAFNYIQELFAPLLATIQYFGVGALKEIWGFVTGTEENFLNLKAIWAAAKYTAQTFWNDIIGYVRDNLPAWVETLKSWGVATWEWIKMAVPIALTELGEWGVAIFNWIGDNLPAWITKLGEWATALWGWIKDTTPKVIDQLGQWAGALFKWLGENLPDFLLMLAEWTTGLFTWIGEAIPKAIDNFADYMTGITDYGNGQGNDGFIGMVGGWLSTLIDWIAYDLIPKVGPEIIKFGIAFLGALAKIAVSLAAAALQIGVDIIVSIANGLLNLLGIPANLDGIKMSIFSTIDSWKTGILTRGGELMTSLKNGIIALISDPKSAITSAIEATKVWFNENLPGLQRTIFEGGKSVIGQLAPGFNAAKEAAKAELGRVMTDVQQHGVSFAGGAFAGRLYEAARASILQFGKGFTESAPNLKQDITNALNFAGNAFAEMNLGGKAYEAWNQIAESFNAFMGQDGFLGHVASVMGDIGRNVIDALASAIINSMEGLRDALNTISNLMPQWVKEKLGIASPSKVFAELGQNVMAGMTQGIQSMAMAPMAALSESMAGMMSVPSQMGATAGASAGNTTTANYTNQRINNFNLNLGAGVNANSEPVQQQRSLIGQLSATYG